MERAANLSRLSPRIELENAQREKILGAVVGSGSSMSGSSRHRDEHPRRTWWLVVVVAGSVSAVVTLLSGKSLLPKDFLTYRYAASQAASGIDVYAAVVSGPHLDGQPFTYTPFASVMLLPTTVFTPALAFALWTVASSIVLAAVLAMAVGCRPSSGHEPGAAARTIALLVVALSVVGWTDLLSVHLHSGQINLMLMGLCLADLFIARSTARLPSCWPPTGLLVGLAAAIKLTPGLFVVYFVITRQWRRAGWAVVGFIVASALGAVLRPRMTSSFLHTVLWTLTDRVDLEHQPSFYGNQSVIGVLAALGLSGAVTRLAVVGVGVAVLIGARRLHRRGQELDAWMVVGLGAPLVSPFSWTHHHVFVLPALVGLTHRWWWSRPGPALAALGAALMLLHLHPHQGAMWLRSGHWWQVLAGVVVRENTLAVAAGCIVVLVISPAWPGSRRDGVGRGRADTVGSVPPGR